MYAPETELRVGGLAPVDAEEAAAFDGAAAAAGPWRAALHAQVQRRFLFVTTAPLVSTPKRSAVCLISFIRDSLNQAAEMSSAH